MRRVLCLTAVLVVAAVGCAKTPVVANPVPTDPFEGICGAVPLPPEPELMAWGAKDRAELDRLRRQGVVAVRVETKGCEVSLELLPQCVGPKNKYVFSKFHASDSRVASNAKELLTQLPVGATSFTDQLKSNKTMRADFKLVGSVALPEGTSVTEYDLVGPVCRRATHVISALYIGGFTMTAGDETVFKEGYPAVCERAEQEGLDLGGCSVPLRVALMPLDGKAPPPRCSAGFYFDGKKCANEASKNLPPCTTWGGSGDETACVGASAVEQTGPEGKQVFDQAAIERVIRQHQANVRRTCWEASALSVKRINVNVTLKVDPQGKVSKSDAQVADAEGPTDAAAIVAKCIANEVMSWTFPEPESEQALTVPFHLIRQ